MEVRDTPYYDIYAARVSPAGAVVDPGGIAISLATREQIEPAVAFGGTNYLIAWTDYRSETNSDLYAARVSPAGAVLDPGGIAISTAVGYQDSPAVGSDGTNYLVAWQDGGQIYGARVSPAGAVLDPGRVLISAGTTGSSSDPTVAFDGTNYLVAWGDRGQDIYAARVSPAGTVLDPAGIAISTSSTSQEWPAVAFDGTNYLVAWTVLDTYFDIYGARVSPAGTVLDPARIPISTAAYNQRAPSVASDGANALVAWQDGRSATSWDVYGARMSPAGAVLDPAGLGIAKPDGQEVAPALAFDGTNYLAAWEDYRSGQWIYGARVSPAGAVLDPSGILISAVPPPSPPPPPPPPPPSPPPPPPPPRVRCKVPRVIGLRLAPARRRIKARHCAVGRIRRVHSRRVGRVIRQSPRSGVVKRFGAPVKLVVGRR